MEVGDETATKNIAARERKNYRAGKSQWVGGPSWNMAETLKISIIG